MLFRGVVFFVFVYSFGFIIISLLSHAQDIISLSRAKLYTLKDCKAVGLFLYSSSLLDYLFLLKILPEVSL